MGDEEVGGGGGGRGTIIVTRTRVSTFLNRDNGNGVEVLLTLFARREETTDTHTVCQFTYIVVRGIHTGPKNKTGRRRIIMERGEWRRWGWGPLATEKEPVVDLPMVFRRGPVVMSKNQEEDKREEERRGGTQPKRIE